MKATKTPSGKYRARAYNRYTGKTKSFTAATKKEAERAAKLYEITVKEEVDRGLTLEEGIDFYINTRKNVWKSPRTARDYKRYKQYYSDFAKAPIVSIDKNIVQRWVNDFSANHSAKTTKNVLSFLLSILRNYGGPDKLDIARPSVGRPLLNLPAESDIRTLIATAEEYQGKYNMVVPIYLGAFACMRRGEIAALTLNDIDFENHTISIRHSMVEADNGKWVRKPPKNNHQRKITAPSVIFEKIREYGLPGLNPDKITDKYIKIREKCDVKCRFHDLRHFCAAKMLSMNPPIPISVVQEYGGWDDQSVLLKIYNYVINESRQESMQVWDQYSNLLATNLPQITPNNEKSP